MARCIAQRQTLNTVNLEHKKSLELTSAVTALANAIPDIDIEILADYSYTYETYFAEAGELSKFIYEAKDSALNIICQCDYGQSRSAACAAAILQHFEGRGIDIFADFRYYPNQLVYLKIFDALERLK